MSDTKMCNACKEDKATTEFYKNRTTSDGLARQCKRCQYEYNHSERGRAVRRKYAKTAKGKAAVKRSEIKLKDRRLARQTIRNAINCGKLKSASKHHCKWPNCNEMAAHWHHESYARDKWLDVIAYCVRHHHKRDQELGFRP